MSAPLGSWVCERTGQVAHRVIRSGEGWVVVACARTLGHFRFSADAPRCQRCRESVA